MQKLFVLLLFLIVAVTAFGQEKIIPTIENFNKNYYTNITFLSEGGSKTIITKNGGEVETAFRVIITTSEIYNNLIIEKVTYGSEGGNKTIMSKKKIDLSAVWENFKINGEIAGLEFIKWITWNSFELKILDKKYIIKNIGATTVKVLQK